MCLKHCWSIWLLPSPPPTQLDTYHLSPAVWTNANHLPLATLTKNNWKWSDGTIDFYAKFSLKLMREPDGEWRRCKSAQTDLQILSLGQWSLQVQMNESLSFMYLPTVLHVWSCTGCKQIVYYLRALINFCWYLDWMNTLPGSGKWWYDTEERWFKNKG